MSNSRRQVLEKFEANRDFINKRVSEGIEKARKGDFTLNIKDENGNAISGAKVEITQDTHAFRYGANLFMLDEFETEEKNEQYRERFRKAFNIATLPFYWKDLEPEEGKLRFTKDSPKIYRRPNIDLCLEYCEENGIEPKEHCLFYETWLPDWLDKTDLKLMREKHEERFKVLAERYKDRIHRWEVTNETNHIREDGSVMFREPGLIEWCFHLAEKYFPDNELAINEANFNVWPYFNEDRSQYYMQIQRALNDGCRIDSIGIQFHMFFPKEEEYKSTRFYYDPQYICRVLDRYADFKKPIQLTEITFPAYSNDAEDEEIQAEILEYLYSLWFAHPAVEVIQYWNLVDGYAAFAPQGDMSAGENYYHGGLLRFDLTPKPAYYRIKELFGKRWRTNLSLNTDDNGTVQNRGFYGNYTAAIVYNGKKIEKKFVLKKNAENVFDFTIAE